MYRFLLRIGSGFLACGLSAAESTRVWIEREGIVAIACEGSGPHGWALENEVPGFLGSGYLHHTGSGREVIYPILITTPGTYRIAIRNFHDNPDSTLGNDCFLGVDDGQMIKCFSSKKDAWNWNSTLDDKGKKDPPLYDLPPGLHRIRIEGRSSGYRVDRIHCFLDGDKAASDDSQPESSALPRRDDLEADSLYARASVAGAAGALLAAAERAKDDDSTAARIRAACLAEITSRRAACAALREEWPLGAAEALAQIGQLWSPSKAGKELLNEARDWARSPEAKQAAVAQELVAQVKLSVKRLIDLGIRADDPKAKAYKSDLFAVAATVARLDRDHAGSPQAKQVRAWCRELAIPQP